MKRDISIYVVDMLENMERAERFLEGISYGEFIKDEIVNFAVIRCIEIMGEAAKHIPNRFERGIQKFPGETLQVCEIRLSISISG